jgi:hypothetical protein
MSYRYETEDEVIEAFNEMIDAMVGEFKIGQLSYSATEAWKSVDPIAYRQELLTYVDHLREEEIISEELADTI